MKLKHNSDDTRRCLDLSDEMVNLLVKQIGHELHNYTLYKTFANYFSNVGLNGLKEYYDGRADEELLHHNWIRDYLIERGVFFNYPSVSEVNESFTDHIDIFKLTVDVEEETTELIYSIVDLAKQENDYLTLGWLMQNGNGAKLVMEQAEELDISNLALEIASMDGSWFEKECAILKAYKG